MGYNTTIGTEEGYEKGQQIRNADVGTGVPVRHQYDRTHFYVQYVWGLAWKQNRGQLVDDSVFLYGSSGRGYEYL